MNLFSRMILVLVLAVFSAGSVVHAAGATAMAVDMAMVEVTDAYPADMGPSDCDACGDKDAAAAATCDLVCSTGSFADLPVTGALETAVVRHDVHQGFGDVRLIGIGSLPLRDPPRSIL